MVESWICKICGTSNQEYESLCSNCGAMRDETCYDIENDLDLEGD